ncbi:hypothetical protein PF003_g1536 [Phytophthora fragariae]|nr:hypothetical protein PF003_g1536 [Phytophthora fragariae]
MMDKLLEQMHVRRELRLDAGFEMRVEQEVHAALVHVQLLSPSALLTAATSTQSQYTSWPRLDRDSMGTRWGARAALAVVVLEHAVHGRTSSSASSEPSSLSGNGPFNWWKFGP